LDRKEIFQLIEEERDRQDKLHPLPVRKRHDDKDIEVITNLIKQMEFLAVLVEEIGEVGKALQGEGDLKEELIQSASVCVRWLEHLK
jgi:hypothetical protein